MGITRSEYFIKVSPKERRNVLTVSKNERTCRACGEEGHKEGQETCKHYKEHYAVVFMGKKDTLSNFYECDIAYKDTYVNTSEKAYAYESATFNNRQDLVNDIMRANTGYDVKQITKKIHKKPEWREAKEEVMTNIVREKSNRCRK